MREIKFRVWNVDGKKMQTPSKDWEGDVFIRLNGEQIICIDTGEWEQGYKTDFVKTNLDLVTMQYTGLKDKNGVEIYEEDIVQVYTSDGEKSFTVKVLNMYSFYSFSFVDSDSFANNMNDIEVIGNIYENKNLLNNK